MVYFPGKVAPFPGEVVSFPEKVAPFPGEVVSFRFMFEDMLTFYSV